MNTFLEDNKITINELIRKQRIWQNLSIQQLSLLSGVSASHISRIEGNKRNPSSQILEKLSEPLGISYLKLLQIANLLDSGDFEYVDLESILLNKKCVVNGTELSKTQKNKCIDFIKKL